MSRSSKSGKSVLPNGALFREVKGTQKLANIAKKADVSPHIFRRLMNSEAVRVGTLQTAARNLELSLNACVKANPESRLPTDPEYYRSLRFSYYIDQDPKGRSLLQWNEEFVQFDVVRKVRGGSGIPDLRCAGVLTNPHGHSYKFWASRTNEVHFALAAQSLTSAHVFHAVFSGFDGQVLSGVWIGLNYAHVLAAYRMVLSKDPLDREQLTAIEKSSWLDIEMQAEDVCRMSSDRSTWIAPDRRGPCGPMRLS